MVEKREEKAGVMSAISIMPTDLGLGYRLQRHLKWEIIFQNLFKLVQEMPHGRVEESEHGQHRTMSPLSTQS